MNEVHTPDVLSLRGLVNAVQGHKYNVLIAFVIVFSMICVYAANRGRDYESSSKLFVRKGRETMTIDPTAMASGKVMSMTDTQDREVNSIVSIFRNRDLLEQVVDEIGPDNILDFQEGDGDEPILRESLSGLLNGVKTSLRFAGILETVTPREQAIATLRDGLVVDGGSGSAVIKISVNASSPKLAQMLNKAIIDGYYKFHVLANSATGSLEFFDAQTEKLGRELKQASDKLSKMKIDKSIISLNVKKDAMESQLQAIDNLLMQSKASLAASQSKVKEIDSQMENSFTQIHHQLQLNLLSEKANEASLGAQIEAAQVQRQELSAEIDDLISKEYELVEMQRQVEILDANYRQYVNNLEQVRINKELEDRSISNVNVFQGPSFVDYPVGPGNKVILALGIILAICAGFVVAIVSELLWPFEFRQTVAAQRLSNRQRQRAARQISDRPIEADVHA